MSVETPSTPSTPPAPAAAAVAATPAADAPAVPAVPSTVTIPLETLNALTAVQTRLAKMEEENRQREQAAQQEQAAILAKKGEIENAFELVAGQNPDTNTKSHSGRATWNHLIGLTSALDLTFGFDRVHSLLVPEPNAVGPQVIIGTSYQSLGPTATVPVDRISWPMVMRPRKQRQTA